MCEYASASPIVVIGASAGGVQALLELVQLLPANFGASIFIVLHTSPTLPSRLPKLLQTAGHLSVTHAVDQAEIYPGHIYVAPPDRHLLIKPGWMQVVLGPKENRFRPAIDPLFRTAALAYGDRVIGVLLSGALYDGTAGLFDIKQHGGLTIVQDPEEAFVSALPRHAIAHVAVDHILPIAGIAQLLSTFSEQLSA
ncbi:chemotaxis protein CheB [Oculatella sp. FACHB-28]|uniref:chemotaxis protein CheB n=1 Tax=Oculatella sp. FACHB-28 TaxID=2692845 RepID=UPI001685FA00|nr:chemotaxis protein CheB [Oculatella sp. FACHB-28]MBD2058667.1 chemotaxis protein CheB [Oculatella sp. FACHB-28]